MKNVPKFRSIKGWGNPGARITRTEQQAAQFALGLKALLRRAIELRPDLASLDDEALLRLAVEIIAEADD